MFKQLGIVAAVAFLVVSMAIPNMVDARGFGGSRSFSSHSFGSFSRSSFRSSSSRSGGLFSSFSSRRRSPSPSSHNFSSNHTSGIKTSHHSSFANAGASRSAHMFQARRQRAMFKQRPTVVAGGKSLHSQSAINTHYRTTYSHNPVYSSAAHMNHSTYWHRRSAYYGSWHAPAYVYYGSPSYGLWDTLFLYSLLNNSNNAGAFAYNHQNDPDYLAWRQQAEQEANTNADLRRQLAAMDASAKNQTGAVNPNYLPKGVDPDIAMSQEALQSQRPTLNVCVGSSSGAYYRVVADVMAPNVDTANIVTVQTAGTGEALQDIAKGTCDAAMVQSDGYWNYVEDHRTTNLPFQRVFSPMREAAHLICNASGDIKSIEDLGRNDKVWFPRESGAAVTWRNFIGEENSYSKVQTALTNSSMDVSSNEAALLKASQNKNSCMLYVGAVGATKFMRNVDNGALATNLILVDINDSSLNDTTDPSGSDVYNFVDLSKPHYYNLLRDGGCFGYCSGDVKTVSMKTDFIVAKSWIKAHNKLYSQLAVQLMGLQPRINSILR